MTTWDENELDGKSGHFGVAQNSLLYEHKNDSNKKIRGYFRHYKKKLKFRLWWKRSNNIQCIHHFSVIPAGKVTKKLTLLSVSIQRILTYRALLSSFIFL